MIIFNFIGYIVFLVAWFFICRRIILVFFAYSVNYLKKIKVRKYPPITVVVPCKDEEAVLSATVDNLLGLDYPKSKIQLVLVNDASTDGTLSVMYQIQRERRKDFGRINVISKPPDKFSTKSKAVNYALRTLKIIGDYVYIIDADHLVDEDAFKKGISYFINDDTVGAVNGMSIPYHSNLCPTSAYAALENVTHQRIIAYGKYLLGLRPMLTGANMLLKKDVLYEIGGFDEASIVEDKQLSLKIYEMGKKIIFAPEMITHHYVPSRFSQYYLQHKRWFTPYKETKTSITWKGIFSLNNISDRLFILVLLNYFALSAALGMVFYAKLTIFVLGSYLFVYFIQALVACYFVSYPMSIFKYTLLFPFFLFSDFVSMISSRIFSKHLAWVKTIR